MGLWSHPKHTARLQVALSSNCLRHVTPLDELPLFADLAPATRAKLSAGSALRHFAAGATLFRAGDAVTGLYVVLSGRVRVVRSRDGRQSVVHTEEAGGTLAEVPLFAGGGLPATAIAEVDTRCLHIPKELLAQVMRHDPDVAQLFLRRLALRVRQVVDRLDRLSTQSVMGRLASLLLARANGAAGQPFTLGMTQAAAAEELGTVREVLVRAIATLRREGLVDAAGRGRFVVRNVDALRRRAEE
jgi:CRP/FNR family transcriptional regulator